MARPLERRQKMLLGVLAVLSVILLWRIFGSLGGSLIGTREQGAGAAGLGGNYEIISGLPELTVHGVIDVAYAPRRNLFDFTKCQAEIRAEEERQRKAREAKVLRDKRRQEQAAKQAEVDRVQREREPREVRPRTPEPRVTYLGYVGELEDKIAVFEKRGSEGEIMLAKVGDVIESEFVVRQIDWDRVELGFTRPEFAKEQKTLPMKGAES